MQDDSAYDLYLRRHLYTFFLSIHFWRNNRKLLKMRAIWSCAKLPTTKIALFWTNPWVISIKNTRKIYKTKIKFKIMVNVPILLILGL